MTKNSERRYFWHGVDRVAVGKLEAERYCVFRPGFGWEITAIPASDITGHRYLEITPAVAEGFAQGTMPGKDVSPYFRPVMTPEIRDQIFQDLKSAGGDGVTLTVEQAKHFQDKMKSSMPFVGEDAPEERHLEETPEAYENDESPKYYRHGIQVSDAVKQTPDYYLLGEKEAVLGRVLNWRYSYFDPKIAQWIQHAEVQDLIKLGAVFELPAELPFAFPGHAREISTEEAEKFIESLETSPTVN